MKSCTLKISLACLISFLMLGAANISSAQNLPHSLANCQTSTSICSAGTEGPGGCYSKEASICVQGRLCPTGTSVCLKGGYGPGGCYNPRVAQCLGGAVSYFLTSPTQN